VNVDFSYSERVDYVFQIVSDFCNVKNTQTKLQVRGF